MRLARGAAGTLVMLAALTGCSDAPTPANDSLPSAAPTTAEASESLPPLGPPDLPMPPEAREPDSFGARTFVAYYMAVYNSAQATMDTQYLRMLSKDCTTCDRIAGEIESDALAGYTYRGGMVTLNSISDPGLKGTTAEAAFSLTQAPLTVVDRAGQPVVDLVFEERKSPACGAVLGWDRTQSTWVMNQWDVG